MVKWNVSYDWGTRQWVANREWHTEEFDDWAEAFHYAYIHAVASIHEVP